MQTFALPPARALPVGEKFVAQDGVPHEGDVVWLHHGLAEPKHVGEGLGRRGVATRQEHSLSEEGGVSLGGHAESIRVRHGGARVCRGGGK